MIAADSREFDYVEAATLLGHKGTDAGKKKFIQRRVASRELRAMKASYNQPRISELDLLKYRESQRTLEKSAGKRFR